MFVVFINNYYFCANLLNNMDIDIIIAIIIWVAIVTFSMVSSKKKKQSDKPVAVKGAKKAIFPEIEIFHTAPKPAEPAKAKPAKAKKATPHPALIQPAPAAPALFEEGQRVSQPSKKASAEAAKERTGLRNRKNLRNAIIFGEILRPKFDF